MKRRPVIIFWVVLGAAIGVLIILSLISGWIEKWLWMRELGYTNIFWRLLSIKWALFASSFVGIFLFLWINLRVVIGKRSGFRAEAGEGSENLQTTSGMVISAKLSNVSAIIISAGIALIFGLVFYAQWDTYIRFQWGGPFGEVDPIFSKDVGFYLFRLPFYELIKTALAVMTWLALAMVSIIYAYLGAFQIGPKYGSPRNWRAIRHLSILFLVLLGTWAWGYYLDRFELLYSTRGVVYGVGFTAYQVTRIGLWVVFFAAIALAVLIVINLFLRRFRIMLIGVGSYLVLYFLAVILLPGVVQKFKVGPSELELETPYLKHNIDFTRKAFQLDQVQEKVYPSLIDLTSEDISRNQETINNIRLWDWRPILETYRQTQEIRLYYQFYEVDVGRYHLEDGYHQVMLSARELAPELPAKARTWVNEYLQFTHGYGLVMNFVSKKGAEGLPQYILENIPPVSARNLTVDQPAIYYGEKTPGYRIVSTKVKEFDYPKGNENVYTSYQGKGGIPLDSFWKKILFAWTRSDISLLLTSYLGPDSRIQIWRQVQERISNIAPFLELDKDPYLVLSKGRLYWIQDAYTTSDRFPYAQPYQRAFSKINYIRNSAKVLVDAYEGTVLFYVMDPKDPVLNVYRQAFPGAFRKLEDLSEDLRAHLRYPEDLFAIQAEMYMTYHMTDPQVFYNQEDLWTSPQEKYAGTAVQMNPYYILMRLPGTKELQYLLMMPFTPQNRDNMVAWMAAKCDLPQYGEILVYQLPKERLTFGPIQIEAMIDQNTLISQQLSLWDQRGSRVIRGNLVVIPIDNSFLYVEPVYLTSEGTNIPQLKRIIVISGDKVAMEPTLDESLAAVFGTAQPATAVIATPVQIDKLARARKEFQKAQEAMGQGKWEDFGKAMEGLKKALTSKQ
jgi:uncharacterized membrane protein (UPF0182 family)